MRYVLDTTYLLPAIGIGVEQVSGEEVARFRSGNPETAICEITIFELAARAAKYVKSNKLEASAVSAGIQAILNDDSLLKLPHFDGTNLITTFKLRSLVDDFIDCLITATALNYADVLLTEDNRIHELKHIRLFKELIKSTNSNFEIQRLSDQS